MIEKKIKKKKSLATVGQEVRAPPVGRWYVPADRESSLLNMWRRTVNFRRPERARNEGYTGPEGLNDTQCTNI